MNWIPVEERLPDYGVRCLVWGDSFMHYHEAYRPDPSDVPGYRDIDENFVPTPECKPECDSNGWTMWDGYPPPACITHWLEIIPPESE